MQSQNRYRAEADMMATARRVATTDAAAELADQAWAALITAANHAGLAARWRTVAAQERQTAAALNQPRDAYAMRYAPRQPTEMAAAWTERAAQSQRIALAHEQAAAEWGDSGAALSAQAATAQRLGDRHRDE